MVHISSLYNRHLLDHLPRRTLRIRDLPVAPRAHASREAGGGQRVVKDERRGGSGGGALGPLRPHARLAPPEGAKAGGGRAQTWVGPVRDG